MLNDAVLVHHVELRAHQGQCSNVGADEGNIGQSPLFTKAGRQYQVGKRGIGEHHPPEALREGGEKVPWAPACLQNAVNAYRLPIEVCQLAVHLM